MVTMTLVDLSERREQSRQVAARAELRSSLYAALDGLSEEALLSVIYTATVVLDKDPMYDWLSKAKADYATWFAQLHDNGDVDEFLIEMIRALLHVEDRELDLFGLCWTFREPEFRYGVKEGRLRRLALELVCADDEDDAVLMTKAREIAKLVEVADAN